MSNKEIVYAKFLDCCSFSEDIFWKTVFKDLAYGNTPYGIYISKDFICCNFKNKEFSYKIDLNKTSEVLFKEISDIFKNKFGLLSIQEKIDKRKSFYMMKDNLKKNTENWANIRKKNIKENIIEKYLLKMKDEYELTFKQIRILVLLINIGLVFKVISNNDILYKDSEIKSITGINFKKKMIQIDKEMYKGSIEISNVASDDKKQMLKNWNKLLTELNKNE